MIEFKDKIKAILEACDDKKAYNFKIINVTDISSVCDYFIICSGNSDRQTQAIADEVEDRADKLGYEIYHKEGKSTGRWILIDFGDIIVHVFHKDDRDIYNLETLWNEGEFLDSESFGIKNWK